MERGFMTAVELLKVSRYMMHVPEWWYSGRPESDTDKSCCMTTSIGKSNNLLDRDNPYVYREALSLIKKALGVKDAQEVWNYNDNHTHVEVLGVMDRAIALGEVAQPA